MCSPWTRSELTANCFVKMQTNGTAAASAICMHIGLSFNFQPIKWRERGANWSAQRRTPTRYILVGSSFSRLSFHRRHCIIIKITHIIIMMESADILNVFDNNKKIFIRSRHILSLCIRPIFVCGDLNVECDGVSTAITNCKVCAGRVW